MPYETKPTNRDYTKIAFLMSLFGTAMAMVLLASRLGWIFDLTFIAITMNMIAIAFMSPRQGIDDFVRQLLLESAAFTLLIMAGLAMVTFAAKEELAALAPQIGVLEWPFLIGLLVFYATYCVKRWTNARPLTRSTGGLIHD